MTRQAHIAVALAACALARPAHAGDAPVAVEDPPAHGAVAVPGDGWIAHAYGAAAAAIDAALAARVPPLRPPTPVAVTWKPQRLASIDLGAPLVELDAADLDGDGKAELIALTTRDVVILGARGAREIAIRGRLPLPREPGTGPRAAVGAIAVVTDADGAIELQARVSTSRRGARYRWRDGVLTELGPLAGFPLCTGAAELAPGRDWFGDPLTRRYAVRCSDALVDPAGHALRAQATLGPGGVLDVVLRSRCAPGDAGCPGPRAIALKNVGVAFAVTDVDGDGRPEVITSADGAPGDADQVTVTTVDSSKPWFRRKFAGGVAAVAAADLDGDGAIEVIAAVRLVGAARIDLWLLA